MLLRRRIRFDRFGLERRGGVPLRIMFDESREVIGLHTPVRGRRHDDLGICDYFQDLKPSGTEIFVAADVSITKS